MTQPPALPSTCGSAGVSISGYPRKVAGAPELSWHGKTRLPEIAWVRATAELQRPWIHHLEQGKASSAARLCPLRGLRGSPPPKTPYPQAPAAGQGSRGGWAWEGEAAHPCRH